MFGRVGFQVGVCVLWGTLSTVEAAQWLPVEQYGAGGTALNITSSTTQSPIDSTCSGAIGSYSLNATNASFAPNQIILIHQSRGTGAGSWELNVIQSYSAGTVVTKYPLANAYTYSGASIAQVLVVPQYNSVTVASGQTWYCKAWNGSTGGILAFMCDGTTTINGSINLSGRGFRASTSYATGGGRNYCGEGTGGAHAILSINGNGGGGGDNEASGAPQRAGGGGGGNGTAGGNGVTNSGGSPGTGGTAAGNTTLTSIVFGGAGGVARKDFDGGSNAPAGSGGGIAFIFSTSFTCVGGITSSGTNGGAASYNGIGGGAGAGGSVLIKANTATLGSGIITAAGGTGGAIGGGNHGGNGGSGRVAVYYGTSVNGSTSPAYVGTADIGLIPDRSPTAFALTAPSNATNTADNRPAFTWGTSTDPEGLPISYALKLSTTSEFVEPVYRTIAGLSVPAWTPAPGQEIANGSYYWKVIASDGAMLTESNTHTLTINTPTPSQPTLTSVIGDLTSNTIYRVVGSANAALGTQLAMYARDGSTGSFVTVPGTSSWEGNTFSFDPTGQLASDSTIYFTAGSGAVASRIHTLGLTNLKDVFEDTDNDAGGSGRSMRLERDTRYVFKIAANATAPITVSAYVKVNGSYSGTMPTITLSGLGIDGTGAATAQFSGTAGNWQQLTVTGQPNAAGVLTLKFETFSTAVGAAAWIDDISVSQ